jgi:hypothetical protein
MAVVFDASILIDLFNPRLQGDRKAKLDYLVDDLQKTRSKIIIPTPAFTELMIRADKARDEYNRILSSKAAFKLEPFGERAAMECALLLAEALPARERRQITKVKFKFDWQIIAIASTCKATAIYSEDEDIFRYAKRVNIPVYKTEDMTLPQSSRQEQIQFDKP